MKLYNGEILKNARKSKELTQDEVSEILGIGRRQISQMENGIFDGGLKYFLKYLSLLNLKLDITQNFSGWSEGFERGFKDGIQSPYENIESSDFRRHRNAVFKQFEKEKGMDNDSASKHQDHLNDEINSLFSNNVEGTDEQ